MIGREAVTKPPIEASDFEKRLKGVVGELKGKHDGNRRIGLRADMDALPIHETTGLPYASKIADGMGIVDRQGRAVLAADLEEPGHLGDIALHGIHPVDHHELARVGMLFQFAVQGGKVAVVEPDRLPLGHLRAVHDRSVVQLVQEDHVLAAHQPGNQTDVGVVAGREDDTVFLPQELGQRGLELQMKIQGPVQEAAPGAAGPIAVQRVPGGCQHSGMMGEPEVVVRAQHDPALALDDDLGVFGFGDRPEVGIQPARLDLIGAGVQPTLFEQCDVGLNGPGRHETSRSGRDDCVIPKRDNGLN